MPGRRNVSFRPSVHPSVPCPVPLPPPESSRPTYPIRSITPGDTLFLLWGEKIHACLAPCIPGGCLLHGFLVLVPEAPSHPPCFPTGGRFLLIGTSPLCFVCAITLCTQQEVGCQQEVGSSSRPALATTLLPASSVGR